MAMIPKLVRRFSQTSFRALLCVSLVLSTLQVAADGGNHPHLAGKPVPNATSPEGTGVYYQGSGAGPEINVYSYIAAKDGKLAQYRRGVIESEGKIKWNTIENAPAPRASSTTAQTSSTPAQSQQTAPAQQAAPSQLVKVPGNAALAGSVMEGMHSPEGFTVYRDSHMSGGRQVVYYQIPQTKALVYGTMEEGGRIQWYNSEGQPIAEDVQLKYRPSQAENFLDGWGADKVQRMQDMIKRITRQRGAIVQLDSKAPNQNHEYVRMNQNLQPSKGAQMGGAIGVWYIGMGILAGMSLIMAYPNNPGVLEEYLSKLTDPVGYLMIAGFLMVAYPFLTKVAGFGTAGAAVRAVPFYAAGIILGAMGQGLIMYAMDPDVRACNGTDNIAFKRDMAACDRAYEKFSSEQIVLMFEPAIVGLLAGAGTFLGIMGLSAATGISAWLRSTAIMTGPRAGAIGFIGSGMVFIGAYYAEEYFYGAEARERSRLIAEGGAGSNLYGTGIRESEKNLYHSYNLLKKNNWKDLPAQPSKPCSPFDGDIIDSDCFPKDFKGTFQRYGALQDAWRTNLMRNVIKGYNNWATKVELYHMTMNSAYTVYSDFISRIRFNLNNPNASDIDARGFNPTSIRNLEREKTNGSVYKGDPNAQGREVVMGLDKDRTVSNGETIMDKDFSGNWQYVDTKKYYDYIVTAMACGPEAESRGIQPGIGQQISDVGATIFTGNTSPREVLKDQSTFWSRGWNVKFTPPKIVEPLDNAFTNVCEKPNDIIPKLRFTAIKQTPDKFYVGSGLTRNLSYRNLYDYIRANVRPGVLTADKNSFDFWWSSGVMGQVIKAEKDLREDYAKMLVDTYKPVLVDQTYYDCSKSSEFEDIGIDRYLRELNMVPGTCAPEWRHRVANGIFTSVRDEARLVLAMLIDVHMSNRKEAPEGDEEDQKKVQQKFKEKRDKTEYELLEASKKVAGYIDLLYNRVSMVRAENRKDFLKVADAAGNAFVALQSLVTVRKHWPRPREDGKISVEKQLLGRINGLIAASATYYNILHLFETTEPDPVQQQAPVPLMAPTEILKRIEQQKRQGQGELIGYPSMFDRTDMGTGQETIGEVIKIPPKPDASVAAPQDQQSGKPNVPTVGNDDDDDDDEPIAPQAR